MQKETGRQIVTFDWAIKTVLRDKANFDVSHDGDDYIYHGKTEFTGFHTHHPATLKKSLVGDQVRIGVTMGCPLKSLLHPLGFPNSRYAGCSMTDNGSKPGTGGIRNDKTHTTGPSPGRQDPGYRSPGSGRRRRASGPGRA